jgi:hypothetical protein
MSPTGSDDTTGSKNESGDTAAMLIPPPTMSVGMFTEILTVAPGQAAAGVKVIGKVDPSRAKTGETPANATRTTSNTIEIVL